MGSNHEFVRSYGERSQPSFFKVVKNIDTSSENMRAIPHDFARSFPDDELLGTMKITVPWGSTWEVKISKNPRFYFMEKSGWEKFVRDNALGRNEFLCFTHKEEMDFSVNIMKQTGKEMVQPPKPRDFLASSSRVKTEQGVKTEEVVVSSELSARVPRTAAGSSGGGRYKRKLNFEEKKAEEPHNTKRTERAFSIRRDHAGASSSSVAGFEIVISKTYLISLALPRSAANVYMPRVKSMVKIHHPDGKKSWSVVYLVTRRGHLFSGGWRGLCKEYPVAFGDTCKFTLIKPLELLLVVTKP
ncbi:PREDICTED: B3 domain-containing protein REM23-like [Camelina sativa]|uniref:B3 domain-containing protein REM23-like n=1 Tax=Camelina sativa TaxID=90675 RepID=A0ABM0XVI8_CAMSA|nr:PREDICTED: B3 domain-containing protein REM23-like [Camelina sativa]XP_010491619.1 PREDICTED: B3 domain-containing protein REM23-like [Camelina sativa]